MELAEHRRIKVQTEAVTDGGKEVVVQTWIRLFGDTQTDVLKNWIQQAKSETVQVTVQAHFEAVAVRAESLESLRLFAMTTKIFAWLGSTAILIKPLWPLLEHQEWEAIIPMMLSQWHWLLAGFALPIFHQVGGRVLRWRLRQVFRRGLTFARL